MIAHWAADPSAGRALRASCVAALCRPLPGVSLFRCLRPRVCFAAPWAMIVPPFSRAKTAPRIQPGSACGKRLACSSGPFPGLPDFVAKWPEFAGEPFHPVRLQNRFGYFSGIQGCPQQAGRDRRRDGGAGKGQKFSPVHFHTPAISLPQPHRPSFNRFCSTVKPFRSMTSFPQDGQKVFWPSRLMMLPMYT